ncbi:hypothetical protein QWT69_03905 [Sporosarcina oncorhynchi]|uniref:Cation efflux protein cytoplasmic domain-containing protein n=1 Tax=Sporosarcina oncorhynchi TaxID=3056444 RepID=A0ABZ0L873_9BACL|nr:hypothetical protein [Sporosarcina sp. T2O-4]WOV88278.1 hypothetical protein QWT69_03905 [Sporosarcina sp. T2O-4]
MKKTAILSALLGCSIILGACSDKEDTSKENVDEPTEQVEQTQQNLDDQNAVDKSDSAKSDDELKEAIEKEEGVASVSLIVTEDSGGYVLLDIDADEEMSKESAEELASTYLKTVEEKYPDHKIDIQVRKNGDTFAQDAKG